MGSVWLADHLSLNAPVVVKFMARELAANNEARTRFSREATAAARLRSPHVVQVFDHGVTNSGEPYIVMEFLEGRDFASLIEQRGPLPPSEVEHVIGQVGKALSKAHGQGIVHRDIKPENIFLCGADGEEPFVKLLDFGIAKTSAVDASAVSTRTGALLGTPLYMSPEQVASGKHVDFRADIWAIGVVVFEALTGQKPFLAEDFGTLVLLLHTSEPPRLTARMPALPASLDAWFSRACARQPEHRFGSIDGAVRSLKAAIRGDSSGLAMPAAPIPAPATAAMTAKTLIPASEQSLRAVTPVTDTSLSRSQSPAGLPRTNPVVWIGAAILGVAVLVGAGVGVQRITRTQPNPVEATVPPPPTMTAPEVTAPTQESSAPTAQAPPLMDTVPTPAVSSSPRAGGPVAAMTNAPLKGAAPIPVATPAADAGAKPLTSAKPVSSKGGTHYTDIE